MGTDADPFQCLQKQERLYDRRVSERKRSYRRESARYRDMAIIDSARIAPVPKKMRTAASGVGGFSRKCW